MNKLRLTGAALSILTVLLDGLFFLAPGVPLLSLVAVAFAAACLAAVAPFEALDPPARKRVLIACMGYVAGVVVAGFLVLQADGEKPVLGLLGLLAVCGLLLCGWAFKTRNRRRRAGWGHYYDS